MRDGNILTQVPWDVFEGFLVYLWGMETRMISTDMGSHFQFLVYLWGMETPRLRKDLRLPVRFLVYLWGMETQEY